METNLTLYTEALYVIFSIHALFIYFKIQIVISNNNNIFKNHT